MPSFYAHLLRSQCEIKKLLFQAEKTFKHIFFSIFNLYRPDCNLDRGVFILDAKLVSNDYDCHLEKHHPLELDKN